MPKELLFSITKSDFRVDTFRAGGPGGQNQNSRDTGVRITHLESGAVGEARDSRYQKVNRRQAFDRLVKSYKFKIWLNQKVESTQEYVMPNSDIRVVRTYHFPRQTVKDHRSGEVWNLKEFMDGNR